MKTYVTLLEDINLYTGFCVAGGGDPKKFRSFDSINNSLTEECLLENIITQLGSFTDPDVTGEYAKPGFSLDSRNIKHNFDSDLSTPSSRNYLASVYNESLARHHLTHNNDDMEDNRTINRYTAESNKLNSRLFNMGIKGKQVPDYLSLVPAHVSFFTGNREDFPVRRFDHIIDRNRLPHPVTVYTGYHGNPNAKNGKNIMLHAYTSTSLTPNVAKDFGQEFGGKPVEKHIFRLSLPKGFPHAHTVLNSMFPEEDEVLLPRGLKLSLPDKPTHIISGNFDYCGDPRPVPLKIHLWDAKIHNDFS